MRRAAVLDAAYAVWPTRLVEAAHAEPARLTAADPGRFASARQFL
ncbi:hypothetical protein [Streptomyces anulatus]